MRLLLALLLCLLVIFTGCSKSKEEVKASLVQEEIVIEAPKPKAEIEEKKEKDTPDVAIDEQVDTNEEVYVNSRGRIEVDKKQPEKSVAYLRVPGTKIDDWVMWASDNNYFLRKNNEEQYNFAGSYYLDMGSRVSPLTQNVIIYGHNLSDNEDDIQFAGLLKYKDPAFTKDNSVIQLQTPEGTKEFKVFSAFDTEVSFNYIADSPSGDQFNDMVRGMKEKSYITSTVPVELSDTIITLSTCTYKYGNRDDVRYVVVGKLLKEGEDHTTYSYALNTTRKEPDFSIKHEDTTLPTAQTDNYEESK